MKFRKTNLVALCFADRGLGVIKPVKGMTVFGTSLEFS